MGGSSVMKWVEVVGLVVIALAIGLAGIAVGELDDAPGASVGGLVLMIFALLLAVRAARRKS